MVLLEKVIVLREDSGTILAAVVRTDSFYKKKKTMSASKQCGPVRTDSFSKKKRKTMSF